MEAISETSLFQKRKTPNIERREKNPLERSHPIEWKKSSLPITSILESSNNICILRIRLILEIHSSLLFHLSLEYFPLFRRILFRKNLAFSLLAKLERGRDSSSSDNYFQRMEERVFSPWNDFNNVSRDNPATIWIWNLSQDFFHGASSTMTRRWRGWN